MQSSVLLFGMTVVAHGCLSTSFMKVILNILISIGSIYLYFVFHLSVTRHRKL